MKMKFIVIVVCAALFGQAYASDWFLLLGNSEDSVYVDNSSIKSHGKNVMQAWTMTSYKNVQRVDGYPPYKSLKSLAKYNCKDGTFTSVQNVLYSEENGEGNSVFSYQSVENFQAFVPDTVGEARYKHVCKQ